MREVAEWYAKQPNIGLVFEGKVTKQKIHEWSLGGPPSAMSMTPSGSFRTVSFSVSRVFRGKKRDRVSLVTGLGTGDCGYDFETGATYLVFASAGPKGSWFTSICSGTTTVEEAGTTIRFLSGDKPTSEDLLSPTEYQKLYFENIVPQSTGSVCGHVLKPDGTPLKGATVNLWEVRNDGLPSRGGSDPNTSNDEGHFCVENVPPSDHYLLTAENEDLEHSARLMAFYPGVKSEREAVKLKVKAGSRLSDIKVTTFRESLYQMRIGIETPHGTKLSYKNGCGVAVSSIHNNPLSYHDQGPLQEDGTATFGHIPDGEYIIVTYCQPDLEGGEVEPPPEASAWKVARKKVVVHGDTDLVILMGTTKSK